MIASWIKKHFWEQWWKGVTFIVIALGFPAFLTKKLTTLISIPLGLLFLLALIIIALLWGHLIHFFTFKKRPKFYSYKEEYFPINIGDTNIKYRWQYVYSQSTSKYRIDQISAYCPNDDSKIVGLVCSSCSQMFTKILDDKKVKARIESQIRDKFNIEPKDFLEDL